MGRLMPPLESDYQRTVRIRSIVHLRLTKPADDNQVIGAVAIHHWHICVVAMLYRHIGLGAAGVKDKAGGFGRAVLHRKYLHATVGFDVTIGTIT